jgi:hypothetical protein
VNLRILPDTAADLGSRTISSLRFLSFSWRCAERRTLTTYIRNSTSFKLPAYPSTWQSSCLNSKSVGMCSCTAHITSYCLTKMGFDDQESFLVCGSMGTHCWRATRHECLPSSMKASSHRSARHLLKNRHAAAKFPISRTITLACRPAPWAWACQDGHRPAAWQLGRAVSAP